MSFNNGPTDNGFGFKARRDTEHCRGDEGGVLRSYVNHHADPRAKAYRTIDTLARHIGVMLNNVAATIGGRPSHGVKTESLKSYPDFFDNGHSEEYKFGDATLILTFKFAPPGILKLVISVKPVEKKPEPETEGDKTDRPSLRGSDLNQAPVSVSIDHLVNTGYDPRGGWGNGDDRWALIKANGCIMSELGHTLAIFSDSNNLAFYVQGMLTDGLTYIFVDQDERHAK